MPVRHDHHHLVIEPGPIFQELLARFLPVLRSVNRKLEAIMATNAELAQSLKDISAQLAKASAEIADKIGKLEAAIVAGGGTDAAVDAALADVKAAAQALDDVVPDAPV